MLNNCAFPRARLFGTAALCLFTLHSALAQWDAPDGFYDPIEGLEDNALRLALHDLIDDQTNLGYGAARTALRTLDRDPDVEGNILLIYSGESVQGSRFNTLWNREHVWPQSYGADSDTVPGADLHHLYPADPGVNSARSNKIFDYTNPADVNTHPRAPGSTFDSNSWEPRDEDKGKIARAMLYMDVRYDGFPGPRARGIGQPDHDPLCEALHPSRVESPISPDRGGKAPQPFNPHRLHLRYLHL
jgi:endonuclease I